MTFKKIEKLEFPSKKNINRKIRVRESMRNEKMFKSLPFHSDSDFKSAHDFCFNCDFIQLLCQGVLFFCVVLK